jgi:TRAP-type mannitol/chloroaromatic compound transport system permease large subunit
MLRGSFRNTFSFVFADPVELPHSLAAHQLHFVQSDLIPRIANEILDLMHIPKHSFLHSILQNSKQAEVTQTHVGRRWWEIRADNLIAPHLVNDFLSIVAAGIVQVHS